MSTEAPANKKRRTAAAGTNVGGDDAWEACRRWVVVDKGGAVHSITSRNGGLVATEGFPAPGDHRQSTGQQQQPPPLLAIPLNCCISAKSCQTHPGGAAAADAVGAAAAAGVQWQFAAESDTVLAAFIGMDARDGTSDFSPYYGTLPPNAAFESLPRRWTDDELVALLAGCAELTRKAKGGREAGDQLICTAVHLPA